MKRRSFLKHTLQAGALIPLASSGIFARPVKGFFYKQSAAAEGRILVLINLNGGNDGLNTIVPFEDSNYYNARNVLAVKKEETFPIAENAGINKVIPHIHQLYGDGYVSIVQNVGYPNQDRSHFRSTDIWHSASDANELLFTGWTGRYLETIHPEYPATLPNAPFAIQVSNSTTLLIQGSRASMGMAIDSPDRFYDLANGLTVSNDPLPDGLAGPQLEYIRRIILESDNYSNEINKAVTQGKNYAEYQSDSLSQQFKGVARLIDGGLPTTIYVVTLNGFDTHYKQKEIHETLLAQFSVAVKTFFDDLTSSGRDTDVVCVSYSEFGRRLAENNALGTDHGAAAPQFVIGRSVLGGRMLGPMPDLADLDSRGDAKMKIDFRQIYATLLEDWLGFGHDDTVDILGGEYEKLPLFRPPASVDRDDPLDASAAELALTQNSPNPASTTTSVRFRLPRAGHARLTLVSSSGRTVAVPLDRTLEAGDHTLQIDLSGLPSGAYLYRLEAAGRVASRQMSIVR